MDSLQLKKEKAAARELRQSRWWQEKLQNACCYYCQRPLQRSEATMDHVLPLSRGGRSTRSNTVVACKTCNTQKHSQTLVEWELSLGSRP